MTKFRNFCFLIISTALLFSCNSNPVPGRNSGLPNVTGTAGEVLVVMDNNLWKSPGGNIFRESLEKLYPALPQPEPLFDVIHITSGAFDDLFRMHRSIVIADVSSTNKAEVKFSENAWARPQLIIRILAPNLEAFDTLVKDNAERIVQYLEHYDRKRLAEIYRATRDVNIKSILSKFNVDIAIPRGYNIDINADDFVSLSIETNQTSQVVFIYSYPYTNKYDLSTASLLDKRNEFLKKYTEGSRKGSYMTTSTIYPPLSFDLTLNSKKYIEIRGLWELNVGYMGGPFISHTTLNSANNKIVTVEAYVYNPNNKKRNLMRQMEAIVYSFEINN